MKRKFFYAPLNRKAPKNKEFFDLQNLPIGGKGFYDLHGWLESLPAVDYNWDWVNHSENFTKPGNSSVHTNTIEG